MNPKAIEAFRAVMLSGSMTAAARDLHTTQPNISRLISRLEYQLDMKLFERMGNKLQATDEAIAFFSEVEQHYIGLNTLRDVAGKIRQFGTGRLRISTAPMLSHNFLAKAVQRFTTRYPDVTLSIRICNSNMVEQLVASQLCEIGLAAYVGRNIQDMLRSEEISRLRGICVLPEKHMLASRRVIEPQDLANIDFISISHQDGTRDQIDALFDNLEIKRNMRLEAENSATVCELVALGLGVSIVSPLIAQDYTNQGLVMRTFSVPQPFPITMLTHTYRHQGVLGIAFSEAIADTLAELNLPTMP